MITNEVVNKGIDYILNHLNDDITVDEVAAHCHFSKFYFSRIFKLETGESVYGFIKRLKVERSAISLRLEPDSKIIDIGYKYGYSPSNYSAVFKQHHHMTPRQFKKNNQVDEKNHPFDSYKFKYLTFDKYQEKITIKHMEDTSVLYERHIGNYKELKEHWIRFMDRYTSFITADTIFLEKSYDDPSITNVNQCICDICMTIASSWNGENKQVIKGGKFAVYSFQGPTAKIFEAYQGIFNVWLPKSRYVLDERMGFDIYRYVDEESSFVDIDIYIPII